ncbi:MAG: hypothetical protein ACRBK7_12185 [Acidimicrobiales bacterium]
MSVSEFELARILAHCRELLDAGSQLNNRAVGRHRVAADALRRWSGQHGETFRARLDDEAEDLSAVSRSLRAEADEWAWVWAQTVNDINRRRREAAVERAQELRGVGEQIIDVFHGDDSEQQVRSFDLVAVPTAASRYAATGGLETF